MSATLKQNGFIKDGELIQFYLDNEKRYETNHIAFCFDECRQDGRETTMIKHGDIVLVEDHAKQVRDAQNSPLSIALLEKLSLPPIESDIKVISFEAKHVDSDLIDVMDKFVFNTGFLGLWLEQQQPASQLPSI